MTILDIGIIAVANLVGIILAASIFNWLLADQYKDSLALKVVETLKRDQVQNRAKCHKCFFKGPHIQKLDAKICGKCRVVLR